MLGESQIQLRVFVLGSYAITIGSYFRRVLVVETPAGPGKAASGRLAVKPGMRSGVAWRPGRRARPPGDSRSCPGLQSRAGIA